MKKFMAQALVVGSAVFGVSSAFAGGDIAKDHIFSERFRQIYRERSVLMDENKTPVKMDSGIQANDCRGYLEAEKTSSTNDNFGVCEYDICHILDAFMKAAPSSGYRPQFYSKEILERLEWRGLIEGFENERNSRRTLAEINDPLLKVTDNYSFERTEDKVLYFSFSVVSDADLNGNGKPDWLFSYGDKWLEGSGFTCATGVIWDVEPVGLLRVDVYPLRLK